MFVVAANIVIENLRILIWIFGAIGVSARITTNVSIGVNIGISLSIGICSIGILISSMMHDEHACVSYLPLSLCGCHSCLDSGDSCLPVTNYPRQPLEPKAWEDSKAPATWEAWLHIQNLVRCTAKSTSLLVRQS